MSCECRVCQIVGPPDVEIKVAVCGLVEALVLQVTESPALDDAGRDDLVMAVHAVASAHNAAAKILASLAARAALCAPGDFSRVSSLRRNARVALAELREVNCEEDA